MTSWGRLEKDTPGGELRYGPVTVAVATMGYKHRALPHSPILKTFLESSYQLKTILHVDGSKRIFELVRYHLEGIDIKGALKGPAALEFFHHALAPVATLSVLEVRSGFTS